MMNLKRELLLIEHADLGPVIDDVLHDLHTGVQADLLAILAEAKPSGLPWRTVLSHLDDADLDTGRDLVACVIYEAHSRPTSATDILIKNPGLEN